MVLREEVQPPWVEYPGFGPGSYFWRDAGVYWFSMTWEPYYKSLSKEEQSSYLDKWKPPVEWWNFYFDPAFREWMDDNDDPE